MHKRGRYKKKDNCDIKMVNYILMSVFCIFRASGEGDGWTIYNLVLVSKTLEGCKEKIGLFVQTLRTTKLKLVHPDMKKENNYTFVGKRYACDDDCPYGYFGGYIIEEVGFDTIIS